jgi:phage tail sheath protein FI
MAARTIASPGVQINEVDLSLIARPTGETNIFMTGFADQGPTDEVINVTSLTEYEEIFGVPTNAAERYSYHAARQILTTSPANLLVTRMPYGSGAGVGYTNSYSALVYPISSNGATYETSTEYRVLEPESILLTDAEYQSLVENDVAWSDGWLNIPSYNFDGIGRAGFVVVNAAKTTVSNLYEGFYVALADNSNNNPATNFDAVTGVKSVNSIDSSNSYQTFVNVPSSRFGFQLTQNYQNYTGQSVSEVIENFPTNYDFATAKFNDYLTLMVFKLRPTTYSQDTVTLDYVVTEGYTGSLYTDRTQQNPNGGSFVTSFIDNLANARSANIKVITNPYISTTGDWINGDGTSKKSVRVQTVAKNLYSAGVYVSDTDKVAKDVGNIPLKLERVLRTLENNDTINLDVTIEAGLGTIWTSAKARFADPTYAGQPRIYDDTYPLDISVLKNTTGVLVGGVREDYFSITNQFVTFADQTRKDHMFIADPLRNIFVKGSNSKTAKNRDFIFSTDIYWPLRNLYAGIESSYVATYGNWIRTNDTASDTFCWIPASGYIASIFASSAQTSFPWSAPAGFTRGTLFNVSDIAINPTQKQRDLLYKININPIAFFPNDGNVVFGQKTLYRKPSAFDRINVRRLFLTLEKTAQSVLKFFVFEPNTFTTRARVVGALTPIFDQARLNEGLYDYAIVCDERNNTPNTIDSNELRVSLYIQPVRTAEFILADFIATRTGVNFEEILS